MTAEEIKNKLPLVNIDGEECIYMELYNNFISIDGFITMFGNSDLTYGSLMANPNATDGWKNQFTAWREQGILN